MKEGEWRVFIKGKRDCLEVRGRLLDLPRHPCRPETNQINRFLCPKWGIQVPHFLFSFLFYFILFFTQRMSFRDDQSAVVQIWTVVVLARSGGLPILRSFFGLFWYFFSRCITWLLCHFDSGEGRIRYIDNSIVLFINYTYYVLICYVQCCCVPCR